MGQRRRAVLYKRVELCATKCLFLVPRNILNTIKRNTEGRAIAHRAATLSLPAPPFSPSPSSRFDKIIRRSRALYGFPYRLQSESGNTTPTKAHARCKMMYKYSVGRVG